MAIRVTQQTMYNNMVSGMQNNLGAYMESIQQGSTQKKINRPSDDPAGTYRVLTTRVDMTKTAQYQENVDTAKGWLNLADDVLSNQATVAIQGLKALAEQASTGTYTAEQRQIMADQATQYLGQLLNLSNTRFEGKTIFSGHKYTDSAFEMGLGVTSWDEDINHLWKNGDIDIKGASDTTIIVQFTGDGDLEKTPAVKWSKDGGQTWNDPEEYKVVDGRTQLVVDGVALTMKNTIKDENGNDKNVTITAADPDLGPGANNGTMFYIRPAVHYQGDDKDPPAKITVMGDKNLSANIENGSVTSQGDFGKNVLVRIDGDDSVKAGEFKNAEAGKPFTYSYSTDGGATWITPLKGTLGDDGTTRLPVPGGYINIEAGKDETDKQNVIQAGTQILIHPSRADLDFEIMQDTYLSVNSVGKDVFGGVYNGAPAMANDEENLFEVVGAFIGYLQGNNQEGAQRTLAALTTAEKKMLSEATRIGGIENRLSMAEDVLSYQALDQQDRLSYIEDIDLTELLTKLTRQQISYQTVLQSSSMIMKLSLANYV